MENKYVSVESVMIVPLRDATVSNTGSIDTVNIFNGETFVKLLNINLVELSNQSEDVMKGYVKFSNNKQKAEFITEQEFKHHYVKDEEPKPSIVLFYPQEGDELTFGQQVVNVQFNPSRNPDVDEVKLLMARIIDINADERTKRDTAQIVIGSKLSWLESTLHTAAFNACVAAQMAVVKFITLLK